MKKPLTRHVLGLTVASCLLSACATTSSIGHNANNQAAKDVLEQATKSQLRSSFSYETTAYVSNDIRRQALADISGQEMSANATCEDVHDEAYVNLLKTAQAEGLSVRDEKYQTERDQLKTDFLTCREDRDKALSYQPFDFEAFYERSQGLSPEEQEVAFVRDMEAHFESQSNKPPLVNITPLDVKKEQLIHEYLIRPSNVSVIGSYSALQGKLTALPSFDYTAKNLKLAINQPIYIDLKAGGIYLWADNFALLNSELLDVRLGDSWQGKWLYIPINDGSLPRDFTKDLIQSYLKAKKESFMALPEDGFAMVGAESVMTLPFIGQNLPSDKLTLIQNTPTIIKNNSDKKSQEYSRYVFADTLYQEMTSKYPTLTLQMPDFFEREIVDGESVIHVVNADSETGMPDELDKTQNSEIKMNSELLMRGLFLYLQRYIGNYYGELSTDGQQENKQSTSNETTKYTPITHYGIQQGKIAWVHHRYYPGGDEVTGKGVAYMDKVGITGHEPTLVDVFTQIFQNAKHMGEFNRLPSAEQTPNAQNSINLFAYQEALITRFKETNEKPPIIGNMLLAPLGLGVYDDVNDSICDDMSNDASCELEYEQDGTSEPSASPSED